MPDGSTPRSSTIRGVVLLGLFDWVRSEHGDAGLTRVRERLPRDMRHRYAGPRPQVIATTPVPASEMAAVAEAIIALWGVEMSGAKGLEVAAELGEGEARYDLRWS